MSDSVGRISGNSNPFTSPISSDPRGTSGPGQKLNEDQVAFLKLIVSQSPGTSVQNLSGSYPTLNREARVRVIEEVVRRTIEDPHNYYSLLGPGARRELENAVIEQLIPSHYLRGFSTTV